MKHALKDYVSEYEEKLNVPLMNKSADMDLVDYVKDSWKSLEVVPNIKIKGFEYTEKESEIDINKHIFKREKRKRKKDRYDYKFINDDRFGKLTVNIEISLIEKDPETGVEAMHVYPIKKSMLIPLQDDDGYYYIKGKKYYLIYQMVEKSTYTSSSSVTLKSLMPIAVKRNVVTAEDVDGNTYNLPCYYVFVFRKEICIMLFYMSRGASYTLDFLEVADVIHFVDTIPEERDPDLIYFPLSSKCALVVDRGTFNKYTYIQSVVGGFVNICTNRLTLEQLEDTKVWIKKIANPNNYDKGKDILKFFNRLLDETTKKILKTHPYHRQDIYTLIRWIMENYTDLRLKDNLDLRNKRLRCNEYVASLLTKEFSRRLNRIISLGDKATIIQYNDLFKFSGDILIQKMHSSGILRYDDSVNDMNFFSKFKYTNKGPHSLGGKNSNNIGIKYRGIHPSYLGRIDCLVCGNSDPGTSGLLSPFSNINGLYFDNTDEPDDFAYQLAKDLEKKYEGKNIEYVKLDFESKDDFYNALMSMKKFTEDNVKVSGTSREGHYEIVIEEDKLLDVSDDVNAAN